MADGRTNHFHAETLPQAGTKTTHFSMKITEDIRKYAAEQGIVEDEAVKRGTEDWNRAFAEATTSRWRTTPALHRSPTEPVLRSRIGERSEIT